MANSNCATESRDSHVSMEMKHLSESVAILEEAIDSLHIRFASVLIVDPPKLQSPDKNPTAEEMRVPMASEIRLLRRKIQGVNSRLHDLSTNCEL